MLYFGSKDDDGELHNIVIVDERDSGKQKLLTANFGRIELEKGARLSFMLHDGELQEGSASADTFRRITFEELDWRLDIGFFVHRAVAQIPMINALPLREFWQHTQEGEQADRNWYMVALMRKFTFPLANLIFVLLVFPVTTVLSRQSRLVAYLAATGMVAVYFTMAQATDTLIRLFGVSAAVAAWMPNMLFFAIGATLTLLRVRR
jgi:lipopolysaccharide export LptBFGC system permease protein LptF